MKLRFVSDIANPLQPEVTPPVRGRADRGVRFLPPATISTSENVNISAALAVSRRSTAAPEWIERQELAEIHRDP
jgi:hypothetical protein